MSGHSLPRLGDYLLIERVGEGGMAEVFRAQYSGDEHSVGLQSVVVVKRIKPELFNKPEFPIFREMFLNEAKLVRSLQHPNLARVYALLEAVDPVLNQTVPFIVQEYVRGQQLWELLRIATRGFTGRGVPVGIATFIGREMARGLGHAHSHKDAVTGKAQPIIHRDISPENVMVSSEGSIKVIDFGVAKALGGFGPQTRTGIIKGKLAYMAPEQVAQKVVPATDVFGAGIVLHEMLTGRRLFGGHNDFIVVSRVLKAEIPRPSQLHAGIPQELDDVVMTALSRDLKTRYVDGNALADALTRVMAKLPDMKGITTTSVKQWSKQVLAEGAKISSNWGEEESGIHVDVDVNDAIRRVEGSGDDIIELTADDLMKAELDGNLDPGVRAAVTQGLKTLRPDMLPKSASRSAAAPVSGLGEGSGPALQPLSSLSLPGMGRALLAERAPEPVTALATPEATALATPAATALTTPAVTALATPAATALATPAAVATRPIDRPPLNSPVGGLRALPSPSNPPSAQSQPPSLRSNPPSAQSNPSDATRRSPTAISPSGLKLLPAPLAEPAPLASNISAPDDSAAGFFPSTVNLLPRPPLSVEIPQLAVPVELPLPPGVHPAFFDKQVERWVKFIAALVALALVLVLLLLLRD